MIDLKYRGVFVWVLNGAGIGIVCRVTGEFVSPEFPWCVSIAIKTFGLSFRLAVVLWPVYQRIRCHSWKKAMEKAIEEDRIHASNGPKQRCCFLLSYRQASFQDDTDACLPLINWSIDEWMGRGGKTDAVSCFWRCFHRNSGKLVPLWAFMLYNVLEQWDYWPLMGISTSPDGLPILYRSEHILITSLSYPQTTIYKRPYINH